MRRALCLLALPLVLACPGGDEWTEPFAAEDFGWVLSVAGSSEALFVVGGQPGTGRLRVRRGGSWSGDEALPAGTGLLNWVHAFAPDDVFAVGEGGRILHYDGSAWQVETTTVTEDLWGVWGASSDDVWAVGGRGRAEGQATLLRRQQGTWRAQALPPLERPGVFALFKVWGASANDVFVVGQRGAVLRFDGTTWTEEGLGTSQDMIAVWGSSPNHVVAVGGRGNGVAAVWDGASWNRFDLGTLPGLNGVWTGAAGSAWVAGEAGTLGELDTATGEVTLFELPLTPQERQSDFHDVFQDERGGVVSGGGNFLQTSGPYRGLLLQRDP